MKKLSLDQIKKIELDMLLSFHTFCEENKLQYSLCGGTLLGAIRHKGFIPWDDDIDVFMPRPDYEKLRKLCSGKCITGSYYLTDWKVQGEKNSKLLMYYPFLKLIDLNTEVDTKDVSAKYYTAIWIDIFPIDGLPASEKETKKIFKKVWLLRQFFSLHFCKKIIAKGPVRKLMKIPFWPIARMMNGKKICKRLDELSETIDYDSSELVGGIINGYGPQEKISKSLLEPMEVEFEGHVFCGIRGYDVYLSNLYGEYMQLPPESKRICHGFDAYEI